MRRTRTGTSRTTTIATVAVALAVIGAGPALACAALIGPNGSVQVQRTTTLAAYHDGIEHYLTSFEFAGGGAEFGAIVPLPDVPTEVEKGGDWSLQRLVREVTPAEEVAVVGLASRAAGDSAEVLQEVRIDALDLTVLRGGGDEVGRWAREHGFRLTPDFPELLDFYAARSPIFLAARFDPAAAQARGQQVGDGTPVHLTIPTDDPWVPLRILGAGATGQQRVEADVFLLTDRQPALLPAPRPGMDRTHDRPASDALLTDLRSDEGMGWVPDEAWLTHLRLDLPARDLVFDLAVDASGAAAPDPVDAGLLAPIVEAAGTPMWLLAMAAAVLVLAGLAVAAGGRGLERRAAAP